MKQTQEQVPFPLIHRLRTHHPQLNDIAEKHWKLKKGGGEFSSTGNFIEIEHQEHALKTQYFIKFCDRFDKNYEKNKKEALGNYLVHSLSPQKKPRVFFREDEEGMSYVSENLLFHPKIQEKGGYPIPNNPDWEDETTRTRQLFLQIFVFGNTDIKPAYQYSLQFHPEKMPKSYPIDVWVFDPPAQNKLENLALVQTYEDLLKICNYFSEELEPQKLGQKNMLTDLVKLAEVYPGRLQENYQLLKKAPAFEQIALNNAWVEPYLKKILKRMELLANKIQHLVAQYNQMNKEKILPYSKKPPRMPILAPARQACADLQKPSRLPKERPDTQAPKLIQSLEAIALRLLLNQPSKKHKNPIRLPCYTSH